MPDAVARLVEPPLLTVATSRGKRLQVLGVSFGCSLPWWGAGCWRV